MLKKKASSAEKRRKPSQTEERSENKRRCAEAEQGSKDDLADAELDRIGSDIEEGGLDLTLPFQPITAYVSDKKEMLQQCLHVLGEKKLRKMLPEELKDCNLEEIQKMCWEQLEPISDNNLLQILAGEDLTSGNTEETLESQQDNNVDSTSSLKETSKPDDPKQEGSGEESDVLSINADTYDSDIEGHKEEQGKAVDGEVKATPVNPAAVNPATVNPAPTTAPPTAPPPAEAKKDLQSDIDRSVSEILALSAGTEEAKEQSVAPPQCTDVSSPVAPPVLGRAPAGGPPSLQQLELLELEMRARAIKALMKASDGKKLCVAKNV